MMVNGKEIREKVKRELVRGGFKVRYLRGVESEDWGDDTRAEMSVTEREVRVFGQRGDNYTHSLLHEWLHTLMPELRPRGFADDIEAICFGIDLEEWTVNLAQLIVFRGMGWDDEWMRGKLCANDVDDLFNAPNPGVVEDAHRRAKVVMGVLNEE